MTIDVFVALALDWMLHCSNRVSSPPDIADWPVIACGLWLRSAFLGASLAITGLELLVSGDAEIKTAERQKVAIPSQVWYR